VGAGEAQQKAGGADRTGGAISRGLRAKSWPRWASWSTAGVIAFSDDGKPVADADLLLHALRYTRELRRPLLLHLEDAVCPWMCDA